MSESISIDEGWEEPLDNDVTHVKGDPKGDPSAGEWLVNVSEQVVVPMTLNDLVEALRSHRLTDRTLVWRVGMEEWTALGDVPPLRLAAGKLAARERAALERPAPVERLPPWQPPRSTRPPPKEAARAARDERVRRTTLPFGFPAVRDPSTIRQPVGLQPASATVAVPPRAGSEHPDNQRPANEEASVSALAIYERAAPSLTFSDSVRAQWDGKADIVHQPAPRPPRPAPALAPAPVRKIEPRPTLNLEPQSDPKPRLTLEPQSDPLQAKRAAPDHPPFSAPAPSSFAPTTSEPFQERPARGAVQWGDLSVVLAADLRAVKSSSKRVTLIASLGSAALASLLTLWFARSPAAHAPAVAVAVAPASQPLAVPAAPKIEPAPAPSAAPMIAASLSPPTRVTPAPRPRAAATPNAEAVAVRVAPKVVSSPPRAAVARPKPTTPASEASDSATSDNPYSVPAEPSEPKAPAAAAKEPNAESSTSKPPASGLEDNAQPVRPAATAAPGF